jgi:hypothetical protein
MRHLRRDRRKGQIVIDLTLNPEQLTARFTGMCWLVWQRGNLQGGVTPVCAASAEEAKLAALGRLEA